MTAEYHARRERIVALVAELLDALFPDPAAPSPQASPSPSPPQLIDKRELARALAVSVATIDRLDREGQPHVRIGDAKRYDLAAVLLWHRERSAEAPPSALGPPGSPRSHAPVALSGVRLLSVRRRGGGR
jgi:hypothetical protein